MRRMAFSYGCLMVRVPEFLAEQIKAYALSIPQVYRQKTEDMPDGFPHDVHFTVKYGLLSEDAEEIANVLSGIDPFVVTLGKASVFHNPDTAVLKIGIESIGLRMLHKRVNQNLAHISTYPGFHPHMTVAYMVKKDDDPYYYQTFFDDSYEGTQFEVDRCIYSAASGKKSIITFDGTVYPLGIGRAARIATSVEESCIAML